MTALWKRRETRVARPAEALVSMAPRVRGCRSEFQERFDVIEQASERGRALVMRGEPDVGA